MLILCGVGNERKDRSAMSRLSAGTAGIIALGIAAAPIAMFATGCSTSAIAATVNGENIDEQKITDYVQNFRKANGLEDDRAWAQWMVDNGRDAESVRTDAIDYFIRLAVIDQDAKEKGISVSDEEVDSQLAEIKAYYDYDDEQFNEQLEAIGYTPESYRDYVRQSLLQEKLMETVSEDAAIDEDEVLSQANAYTTILDGAKDIQVIAVDSKEKADEAKSKLDAGEDFAAVQSEVGSTTDMDGWDVMIGLDSTVAAELENTEKGAVTGVIEGDDGTSFYIVKVNDVLSVGEEGFANVNEIPETLRAEFEATVEQSVASTNFETYIQGLVDGAEKNVNPMPSGLPYDVSTDGVEPTSSSVDGMTIDSDTTVTEEDGTVVDDSADVTTVEGDDGSTTEITIEGAEEQ